MITDIALMIATISFLGVPPEFEPKTASPVPRVHLWWEVDDTFLSENQWVTVTLWMEYDPPSGAWLQYKGMIAKMLWLQLVGLSFKSIATSGPGTYFINNYPLVGINPEYCENPLYGGEVLAPGILGKCTVQNYCPGYNPKPNLKTKNWLYSFMWAPSSLEPGTATFIIPTGPGGTPGIPTTAFFIEVPALGKVWPLFEWLNVTATIDDCPIIEIGPKPCKPDVNEDGVLNIDDFIAFQTLYVSPWPLFWQADCDNSQFVDINDFICFQTQFVLGC